MAGLTMLSTEMVSKKGYNSADRAQDRLGDDNHLRRLQAPKMTSPSIVRILVPYIADELPRVAIPTLEVSPSKLKHTL